MKSIPLSIECTFDKQRSKNTANQVSVIIVAPTEKTLDIILKTPTVRTTQQFALKHVRFALWLWSFWNIPRQYTFFNLDVPLPITLPINEIHGLAPFGDTVDELHVVAAKAIAGKRTLQLLYITLANGFGYGMNR